MVAPHFPSIGLDQAKRHARQDALAARSQYDAATCGNALAEHVLRDCPPSPGVIVAGFLPIGDEIDVTPLLCQLHERGNPIVLPVTPKRGLPLTFRLWTPGAPLISEAFGTRRPTGPERQPDFLLVPLLAFDRFGHRLGYGGGFYDRTLADLPGRFRLGCAFAAQQIDMVPTGPHDLPLDAVATEEGIIRCTWQRQHERPG
jgi:5-formyltetrahydrofolate cyclo-ligase